MHDARIANILLSGPGHIGAGQLSGELLIAEQPYQNLILAVIIIIGILVIVRRIRLPMTPHPISAHGWNKS